MLANNQEDTANSELDDLFGEPPLIKGEDKARYLRLLAAIEHGSKPETIFDKIRVREITDKLWQQQRCKQNAVSLVEGAYMEALASLLRPFNSPTITFGEDAPSSMARDYYSGAANAKQMEMIDSRLAQYGITKDQIRAKAMQLCGGAILMLYRMEANCENSLRMLKKEHDRRLAVENAQGSGETEGEGIAGK